MSCAKFHKKSTKATQNNKIQALISLGPSLYYSESVLPESVCKVAGTSKRLQKWRGLIVVSRLQRI